MGTEKHRQLLQHGALRGVSRSLMMWTVKVLLASCCLGFGVAGAQVISFDPAESLPTDPEFTINIEIDCGGQVVKGAELEAAFDPFLVRLDAITAGSWFTGSTQPYYFFDYTATDPQGVIHLASAILDGTLSGTGTLAVCHFSILDFGTSPLIFQAVDVRGLANTDLGFAHSTGDRIILDPVVGVEEHSFGAIKALFR